MDLAVVVAACSSFHYAAAVVASCSGSSGKLMAVEVIHKVMEACRAVGNYAVASIVRSSVAFDDEDSF